MKKKELLRLPVVIPQIDTTQFEPETVEEKRIYGGTYTWQRVKRPYTARIVKHSGEKYLELVVFDNKLNARFRIFHDMKNNRWCGWDYRSNSQTEAGFDYLTNDGYYHREQYIPIENADEIIGQCIKSQENENGINKVRKLHQQIKENRLKEKRNREIQRFNADMEGIRPLPQKVYDWVKGTLMKKSRYIIYTYSKKQTTTGFCTHCGKIVEVKKPKHRAEGFCKSCRSKIMFLARGRMTSVCDNRSFAYLQKIENGFVARLFNVSSCHRKTQKEIETTTNLFETRRVFCEITASGYICPRRSYVWGKYKQSGISCFYIDQDGYTEYQMTVNRIYSGNVNDIFSHNESYTDLGLLCRKAEGTISVNKILEAALKKKQVEFLLKLRLYRLAVEVANGAFRGDQNEGNIKRYLGIQKQDIPVLQKLNPTENGLKFYKLLKQKTGKVDLKILKYFLENNQYGMFGNLKIIFLWMTPHKLLRYAKTQCLEFANMVSTYKDYLKTAAKLGDDMRSNFILFPKNLNDAHNEAMERIRVQARKDKKEKENIINKMESRINKTFAFQSKAFLLRAPHSADEIRKEGAALHHCVGNYVNEMEQGETIILFVRKKEQPNTPYYTVELNPFTFELIQYRGFGNNVSKEHPVDPQVTAFLNKWQEKIRRQQYSKTA